MLILESIDNSISMEGSYYWRGIQSTWFRLSGFMRSSWFIQNFTGMAVPNGLHGPHIDPFRWCDIYTLAKYTFGGEAYLIGFILNNVQYSSHFQKNESNIDGWLQSVFRPGPSMIGESTLFSVSHVSLLCNECKVECRGSSSHLWGGEKILFVMLYTHVRCLQRLMISCTYV